MKTGIFILMMLLFISSCGSVREKEQVEVQRKLEQQVDLGKKQSEIFFDVFNGSNEM